MLVPQVQEQRKQVVVDRLLWNDRRLSGGLRLLPGRLGVSVAELRAVCVERIHRPFFARVLALQGDELVNDIAARFAELRTQLNLPANPDVDLLLALEQRGDVTRH